MSLATIERAPLSTPTAAPASAQAPAASPAEPRRLHAVPQGTEARGFALYVGLDEFTALDAVTDLTTPGLHGVAWSAAEWVEATMPVWTISMIP